MPATITQKRMRIYATDGEVWGDQAYEKIHDSRTNNSVEIYLPPYEQNSYTSWVNSPKCGLCGATMVIEYEGEDERGNPLYAKVSFLLEK